MMSAPNSVAAARKYRALAPGYDVSARFTADLRARTIALLDLRAGDTVLDVGCGTGLSFPLVEAVIGASGTLIGVDVSPDMLALAHSRVAGAGWRNVTLIEAPLEAALMPAPLDAVLFNYTHDVLRSPAALENIFRQARGGARVACAGVKHPPHWLWPFRLYRLLKARPYVTTFEGLDTPWDALVRYVPDLRIVPTLLGTGYIGHGHYAGPAPA